MTLVSKEWIQDFHENEGQGFDPYPLVEAALLAHELLEALVELRQSGEIRTAKLDALIAKATVAESQAA